MALYAGSRGLPDPFDVSDANTAPLPLIPPTATCVAVTELNKKAAAWIATSRNIRTVCIVDSVNIDPALLPLPHVQRLMFLSKWDCGLTLQSADADRFAATFPNLLEVCAWYVACDTKLAALVKCSKLLSLDLSTCLQITDAGLQHLRGLTALQSLILLYCGKITDAGLQHLRGLAALKSLSLSGCDKLTDAAKRALKSAIPNLNITS